MQGLWLGGLGAIIPWQSSQDDLQALLCSAFCQCWEQEACWIVSAWSAGLAPSVSPGARPASISVALGTAASYVSLTDLPQLQRAFPSRELYLCPLSSQTQSSYWLSSCKLCLYIKTKNHFKKKLFCFCLGRAKEVCN